MPSAPLRSRLALAFLSVMPEGNLRLLSSRLKHRPAFAFLSVIPEGNLRLLVSRLKHRPAFAFLSVIPEGNLRLLVSRLKPRPAFAFLSVIPEGNLRLLVSRLKPRPAFAFLSVIPEGNLRLLSSRLKPRPAVAFLSVIPEGNLRLLSSRLKPRYAALATLLLTIALLGAADPAARANKLGHEMICTCGCTQILMECNHVGCPVSPVMINELQSQVSQGGPDNLILNWFAAKYGATVLAAPMRGGFDNVAWITPLAVFFFSTVGVAFLITIWKKRNPIPAAAAAPMDTTLRARIRQETEY